MPISTKWISRLKKGDVVRSKSGVLRVVRDVKRWGDSDSKTSVVFSILHCSWTKRPTTTMTGTDLRIQGYSPTRAKYDLSSKLDKEIEKDLHGRNGMPLIDGGMTKMDVFDHVTYYGSNDQRIARSPGAVLDSSLNGRADQLKTKALTMLRAA